EGESHERPKGRVATQANGVIPPGNGDGKKKTQPFFISDRPGCWGGLPFAGMPRPGAVVAHVGFYGGPVERWDATAWCRGASRWFLSTGIPSSAGMPRPCAVEPHAGFYLRGYRRALGCHGLVRQV